MPDQIRFSTLNKSISGVTAKAWALIGYDGTLHRSSNVDSCTVTTVGNRYFYDVEFTTGSGLHETSTFMIGAYSLRRNVTSANANMGHVHGQLDIATKFDTTSRTVRLIRRVSGNTNFTAAGDRDTNYTFFNAYDWDSGYTNGQPEYIYLLAF